MKAKYGLSCVLAVLAVWMLPLSASAQSTERSNTGDTWVVDRSLAPAPKLAPGPGYDILYAPSNPDDPAFRAAIAAFVTGSVDYYDARSGTPDVATLSGYECVMTWANFAYANNVLFGDNLAAYVDGGGQVVLGAFSTYTTFNHLSGAIMTPAYSPVFSPTGTNHFSLSAYAGDGTTQIHNGVAAYSAYYRDLLALQGPGLQDGSFLDGEIATAYRPDFAVVYANGAGLDGTGPGADGTGPDWPLLIANACQAGEATLTKDLTSGPDRDGSVHFDDFTNVDGLTFNGSAAQVGTALRLTPAAGGQAGSVFATNPLTLGPNASFSTYFAFQMTNPGGAADPDGLGADGLAFVLQTNFAGASALGGAGGGMGYGGMTSSFAVEFDTWDNGPGLHDPDGNHVGMGQNGAVGLGSAAPVGPPRLNDGAVYYAWIDYDGIADVLEVRLSLVNIRPGVPTMTHAGLGLAGLLGGTSAWAGFTSGTGAAWGDHDILSWHFFSAIDLVVPVGELVPTAYDFTITYDDPENPLVVIEDRVPAEWDVTHIEFDDTADDGTVLPIDCGGDVDFTGDYGMVDLFRGGKPGKKCSSDTGLQWMPDLSQGVVGFYWSNGWTSGPLGGPQGTVNHVTLPDGSDNVVLATTAASGAPLYRVTDVEIDQLRNFVYFTNWHSGPPNSSGDEAIYRMDVNGANQVLFSNASSSPTGFASGLHRLAIDPANGDVYFTRAVSYANPNEVSRVDVTGAGYAQLIGLTDGWFYSGVALDNPGGDVYFGDGGFVPVPPINGALNVMTKAGAASAVLVPWGAGNGMGKTVAFDPNFGASGTAFYGGWAIFDVFQGPGDPNTLGEIYAYDVASGVSTLIYSDPGHGIPDIEVDPINQRIYWTDYVRGEIRSADYNGANVIIEVTGLVNPFGLDIEIGVVNDTLNVQTLARCHDNKKNKKCRPTSCGALYLNYGAVAYDKATGELLAGPTDPICLAAVEDLDGDGTFIWDGTGDEDGDGLTDYAEACEGPTFVCDPDSDDDGVLDGADDCPLEGPADPALGEILESNGCIRQSQCSDGIDNDLDGPIDFPDDMSCADILDDSEDYTDPAACSPQTCGFFTQCDTTSPDGCYCFATDPGITTGYCVDNFICGGDAIDCQADPGVCAPLGRVCLYQTCCGPAVCGPVQCTGVIQGAEMTLVPGSLTATGQ